MAEASNQRRNRQHAVRRMTPRSRVWEHFARFADGDGRDKARCKRCALVLGADTRSGTSTLWAHVRICKGPRDGPPAGSSPPQPMMLEHIEEGGGGNGDDLARMIALHGYDPSFVDDGYFRRFVRSLNPDFEVPTREAIEEMCDGIFDEARRDIFSRISNAPGRVSLAVGTVRTNEGEVLYTACHFIDDEWILHRVIMDAYVDGRYPGCRGPLMGVYQTPLSPDFRDTSIEQVMDDFSRRGVLDNLFMMVWKTIGRGGGGADIRLQLRNEIEKRKYNTNPSMTQLITTSYMDNVFRSIGTCLSLDVEFDGDMNSDLEDLDLTRQKRKKLLSQIGLDYNLLAYYNCWYSSYCSLEVIRKEGSTLTDTGSEFAELFCKLSGEIYRAIQRISASSCPTSNICFVELFKLREVFQFEAVHASGDNAIAYKSCNGFLNCDLKDVADVLREAMDDLDKSIKDSYLVWSVPLILDPRYKLEYIEFIFRRAYAQSEAASYISEVTRQIKKLYVDYFEYGAGTNCANSDLVTAMTAGSSAYPLQQAWDEHCQLRDSMSTEVSPNYQYAETELDRYLKDRLTPQTESFDILKWWKDNSWNYPTVARMARDALAMPTCSKLTSEQMAHVRSILRGYSKAAFGDLP